MLSSTVWEQIPNHRDHSVGVGYRTHTGGEGRGTRIHVNAWGAVTLTDRGMTEDKLICSDRPRSLAERQDALRLFRLYVKCKRLWS